MASTSGRSADPAPRDLTLMDVARAAGVGKSTVSNVLNGTGRVGEAARVRVLETVEQLGYQPHQGARSMRSRRTMRLAYLMPPIELEPTNLIMMQFMQALLTAAARQHYRVLVVPEAADPGDDIRRLVADRSVDAFVLSGLQVADPRAALLRGLGMPFACFGRTEAGPGLAWVDIDDAAAEAGAVAHVVGRGYRRPSYIGYEPRNPWDAEREAGFRAGLAVAGVAGDTGAGAGVLRVADDASARASIRSFLVSAQPDAVLTGSDKIAIIVYGAAADLSLRIGRDVAVVGFDGSVGAALLQPPLTSVVMPVEDVATRIVARLHRLLELGPDDAAGEILPTWLREGTGPGGSSTAPR
ncbi:MAG TPA: LacI family DNA-binding transcriptional regulator, partial [Streptosporangiaceae bacterium]|nr:LacI family DNA-binding transcriptional regulator [Streptosporangiaceae bacterium]